MLKRLKTKDNNIDKKFQIKFRRETRHISTITKTTLKIATNNIIKQIKTKSKNKKFKSNQKQKHRNSAKKLNTLLYFLLFCFRWSLINDNHFLAKYKALIDKYHWLFFLWIYLKIQRGYWWMCCIFQDILQLIL